MLQTYALILLLNLTDDEQLLASNVDLSDPIDTTMEMTLTKTELNGQVVLTENDDKIG